MLEHMNAKSDHRGMSQGWVVDDTTGLKVSVNNPVPLALDIWVQLEVLYNIRTYVLKRAKRVKLKVIFTDDFFCVKAYTKNRKMKYCLPVNV